MGKDDGGEKGASREQKIEDSEGMCGSESGYDSGCWGRFCRPERNQVLRDVLRGLLVLIILAIVVTVIFLLCYFLLNDIEKKEESIVDDLIKDFSGAEPSKPRPEFSTSDGKVYAPTDSEAYDSGPNRGDLGKEGSDLRDITNTPPGRIDLKDTSPSKKNKETVEESPNESESNHQESLAVPRGSFVPVGFQKDSSRVTKPLENLFLSEGENENIFSGISNNENFESEPFDAITDFVEAPSGSECVPLRLPICAESMPWALSTFPNWVGNKNAQELQESFKYFQSAIVDSRCSAKSSEYSCAILEPPCGPDGGPLPPCKAFCEDIVKSCSEFLVAGHAHNSAFECGQFPDSKDPNICVDISRARPIATDLTELRPKEEIVKPTNGGHDFEKHPEIEDFPDISEAHESESYPSDIYDEHIKATDSVAVANSPVVIDKQGQNDEEKESPEIHSNNNGFPVAGIEPRESESIDEVKIPDTVRVSDSDKAHHDTTNIDSEIDVGTETPLLIGSSPKTETSKTHDQSTEETPIFICDHTKFLCDDGSDCLNGEAVCDGTQHCLDNSDEFNCTKPETTTKFSEIFQNKDNLTVEETTESIIFNQDYDTLATDIPEENTDLWSFSKPSKRPSLSEMISGSALVAVPTNPPTSIIITAPKTFRFSNAEEPRENRGKAIDSSPKQPRNSLSPFGPFPFTSKPKKQPKQEDKDNSKTSPRLSLAALLSSTSLATSKPQSHSSPIDYPVETESPVEKEGAELVSHPTSTTGGRSLSDLLSSSLPSFATSSTRRQPKECDELRCLDGTCISLTQLNDGVEDCPDGSDEQKLNNFSLK